MGDIQHAVKRLDNIYKTRNLADDNTIQALRLLNERLTDEGRNSEIPDYVLGQVARTSFSIAREADTELSGGKSGGTPRNVFITIFEAGLPEDRRSELVRQAVAHMPREEALTALTEVAGEDEAARILGEEICEENDAAASAGNGTTGGNPSALPAAPRSTDRTSG